MTARWSIGRRETLRVRPHERWTPLPFPDAECVRLIRYAELPSPGFKRVAEPLERMGYRLAIAKFSYGRGAHPTTVRTFDPSTGQAVTTRVTVHGDLIITYAQKLKSSHAELIAITPPGMEAVLELMKKDLEEGE